MNGEKIHDCEGKVAFETFARAAQAAKHKQRIMHPYACRRCHKFHVGGGNQLDKRKIKLRGLDEV